MLSPSWLLLDLIAVLLLVYFSPFPQLFTHTLSSDTSEPHSILFVLFFPPPEDLWVDWFLVFVTVEPVPCLEGLSGVRDAWIGLFML